MSLEDPNSSNCHFPTNTGVVIFFPRTNPNQTYLIIYPVAQRHLVDDVCNAC